MDQISLSPDSFDAVVFDVIGTLVDEDSAWMRAAEQISTTIGIGAPAEFHEQWTTLLNERMNAVVSGRAPWQSHQQLVSDAANEAITSLGGSPSRESSELTESLDRRYEAWPDVAEATAKLRRRYLVAGVSNGDLASLARLANVNTISWDIVLSTGSAHTFKPSSAAYEYAIRTLAIDPRRSLFVASHPWDLRAAARHGFLTAYVERPGAEQPASEDRFDMMLNDLSSLAELTV